MILKNGLVLKNDKLFKLDVRVEGDKIVEIGLDLKGENVIDVKGGWIIPGAVDVHAHLREPGYEHKGDIQSETYSAAKGGITTVMAMPNTMPVPCDAKSAKLVYDLLAEKSLVHAYLFGSVTKNQKGRKVSDIKGMLPYIKALSDDGVCVNNQRVLKKAMQEAKKYDLVIASHAEASQYEEPAAEYEAVKREIELANEVGCKYHFCHLSTEESFLAVKRIQFINKEITCEVTPHHLFLHDKCIAENTNFKMNPPLRSLRDMRFTFRSILEGISTMIATDHAPHSEKEKAVEYSKAPNGIIGFETMLPLVYTGLVITGRMTHAKMIEVVTTNPAKRFGLPYSKIEVGSKADIAVLDINTTRKYTKDEIVSKSKNSPYIGMELCGFNVLTLVSGKVVYNGLNNLS